MAARHRVHVRVREFSAAVRAWSSLSTGAPADGSACPRVGPGIRRHTWVMAQPDNLARAIAGASATVSAFSLLISWMAYRRARPKVKVRVERRGISPVLREGACEGEERDCRFALRLINKGSTAVGAERVELVAHLSRVPRRRSELLKGVRFEEPLKVSAFDGTKLWLDLPERKLVGGQVPRYLRFRVSLSDGRTVRSKKLRDVNDLPPL